MLDNEYIKKYKENMTSMMMNINPNWDKEVINRTLDKMVNDQLQNQDIKSQCFLPLDGMFVNTLCCKIIGKYESMSCSVLL